MTNSQLVSAIKEKQGQMNERAAAKEIGISPTTLLKIKRGDTPDYKTLKKISKWCGFDLLLPVKTDDKTQGIIASGSLAKLIVEAAEKFNREINSISHTHLL